MATKTTTKKSTTKTYKYTVPGTNVTVKSTTATSTDALKSTVTTFISKKLKNLTLTNQSLMKEAIGLFGSADNLIEVLSATKPGVLKKIKNEYNTRVAEDAKKYTTATDPYQLMSDAPALQDAMSKGYDVAKEALATAKAVQATTNWIEGHRNALAAASTVDTGSTSSAITESDDYKTSVANKTFGGIVNVGNGKAMLSVLETPTEPELAKALGIDVNDDSFDVTYIDNTTGRSVTGKSVVGSKTLGKTYTPISAPISEYVSSDYTSTKSKFSSNTINVKIAQAWDKMKEAINKNQDVTPYQSEITSLMQSLNADVDTKTTLMTNLTKTMFENQQKAISADTVEKNQSSLNKDMKKVYKTLGILNASSSNNIFNYSVNHYNRFKLPTVDEQLQRGFAHVFFTRPDCNLYDTTNRELFKATLPAFEYTFTTTPTIINELMLDSNSEASNLSHQFMLSLSNRAASFSLSDEGIETDTYGKTYSGWKVSFGRNNVESKTAGDFTITYKDDRHLHIYQLHKLWVEYISGVYMGYFSPKEKYIWNKTLDYASSVYYFITAEDGETIIFWSKYYGVFPTSIPSTQYSWAYGNTLTAGNLDLDVKYSYSFKEDFNPAAIAEFNKNAKVSDAGRKIEYTPVFDPSIGHVGNSWVGRPYIEKVTSGSKKKMPSGYLYKLRFAKTIDVFSG